VDELKGDLKVTQATSVVRKLFELPHDAHVSTPTGEFMQLIGKTFMLDTVVPLLYSNVFPILTEVLIVSIFLILAYIHSVFYTGFLQLLLFIVYAVLVYQMAAKKAQQSKDAMQGLMREFGKIMAVPANYELAHQFGNVEVEIEKGRQAFIRMQEDINKMLKVDWPMVGLKLMSMIGVIAILFATLVHMSMHTQENSITMVELVALGIYFLQFMIGLAGFGQGVEQLRKFVAEYLVLHEYLDRFSDTKDTELCKPIDFHPSEMQRSVSIEFRNVSFSYQDKEILDNISFKVESGQTLGLCGASGSGKTTVLKLLQRFYAPTSGKILVNNKDIKLVQGKSLRELFSVVSQDTKLFNATLRENIEYGKIGASDEEILDAARRAELNLADIAETINMASAIGSAPPAQGTTTPWSVTGSAPPKGTTPWEEGQSSEGGLKNTFNVLDKHCGEGGGKLSGGQQQRVALARALLKSGCAFLLDEPTAALDNVVSRELLKTLTSLGKENGRTVMHITHRLEELSIAEQILYLENGRIVEKGTYKELMANTEGIFARQVKARIVQG